MDFFKNRKKKRTAKALIGAMVGVVALTSNISDALAQSKYEEAQYAKIISERKLSDLDLSANKKARLEEALKRFKKGTRQKGQELKLDFNSVVSQLEGDLESTKKEFENYFENADKVTIADIKEALAYWKETAEKTLEQASSLDTTLNQVENDIVLLEVLGESEEKIKEFKVRLIKIRKSTEELLKLVKRINDSTRSFIIRSPNTREQFERREKQRSKQAEMYAQKAKAKK